MTPRRPGRGASRVAAGLAALAVVVGAAGCADPDLKAADADAKNAVSGCHATPAGGSSGAPTTLPADVAALRLLPDGAVVTGVEQRSGRRTVVSAVVERPFDAVLRDVRSAYERAGFVLEHGEVEKHDAESDFRGQGVKGRWGLRAVSGCDAATTVSVVVAPAS